MSEESPSGSPFRTASAKGRESTLPLGREAAKGELEGDSSRRLFFALCPDETIRQTIRQTTARAVRGAGGRAVRAENWHLTLAFLGAQPVSILPALRDAAAQLEPPKGTLTLDRLGHFRRTLVLWIGPRQTPQTLRDFVAALWEALEPLAIKRERRAFTAHLTLARKVKVAPLGCVQPVIWPYAGFSLVESVTESRGARYKLLADWAAVK
ncbi:MAG: RNA 2',3'-cyclic phosphodiesterase [Gammaproteobacteria bacterium]|nr:RNA 2',3'-cyclic phosphodiesterase [Gammaproteobacteria bacterium]